MEQLHDKCSILHAHPFLQPLLTTVTFNSPPVAIQTPGARKRFPPVSDIVPIALLNLQLPNLRHWILEQYASTELPTPMTTLHPIVLTCLKVHARIETICLWNVQFSGPAEFARLLPALPMLKDVECVAVKFHSWKSRDFMPKSAVRLRTLTVGCQMNMNPTTMLGLTPVAGTRTI